MAEQPNYIAFDWVVGELEETVEQANKALEAYSLDRELLSTLQSTLNYAHQIHGTLRMVELNNLARLAAECEALGQALVNKSVAEEDTALEVLMMAFLQFPGLFDRVRRVRSDIAENALQPIINEIMLVRGESIELSQEFAHAPSNRVAREDFDQIISKLRKMFRVSVLNIVRKNAVAKHIGYIAQIGQRVHKISSDSLQERFWRTALALFHCIQEGSLPINRELLKILLALDSQLIRLANGGPRSLQKPASTDTYEGMKSLLNKADSVLPILSKLKEDWQVEERTAKELRSVGLDRTARRSVIDAVLDELADVQDCIDLYFRSTEKSRADLAETLPVLERVMSTMSVIGLGEALQTLRRQTDILKSIVASRREPDSEVLMGVVENILKVEGALSASIELDEESISVQHVEKDRQLASAHQSVLREARVGIESSKDAVIEYIASEWDHSRLEAVPGLLFEARGALSILPLERVAKVLGSCERFICEQLLGEQKVPDWPMLDVLADGLASADYYLERVAEDPEKESNRVLDIAVDAVHKLGYPIEELGDWKGDPKFYGDDSVQTAGTPSADKRKAEATSAGQSQVSAVSAAPVSVAEWLANIFSPSAPNAETSPASEAIGASEAIEADKQADASASGHHDEDIDEELIEVFSGEVEELTEDIAAALPSIGEEESLQKVRRSLHTLKGSSRTVGARELGEFAWSLENVLNRILDGSQVLNSSHARILTLSKQLLPELLHDYQNSASRCRNSAEVLGVLADEISTGQSPVRTAQDVDLRLGDELGGEFVASEPFPFILPERGVAETGSVKAGEQSTVKADDSDPASEREDSEAALRPAANSATTANKSVPTVLAKAAKETESTDALAPTQPHADLELLNVFTAEAEKHLDVLQTAVSSYRQADSEKIDDMESLHRALHTLKGSARIAGVDSVSHYVSPMEHHVLELNLRNRSLTGEGVQLLAEVAALARRDIAILPASDRANAEIGDNLADRISLLHDAQLGTSGMGGSAANFAAFVESTASVGKYIDEARIGRSGSDGLLRAAAELRQLEDIVREYQQPELGELLGLSASAYEQGAVQDSLPLAYFDFADTVNEGLVSAVDALSSGHSLAGNEGFTKALRAAESFEIDQYQSRDRVDESVAPVGAGDTESIKEKSGDSTAKIKLPSFASAAALVGGGQGISWEADQDDAARQEEEKAELLAIFKEESADLLEDIEINLQQWQQAPHRIQYVESLQRSLHTLKGGARLAGNFALGDSAHKFETALEQFDVDENAADTEFFLRMQSYVDDINQALLSEQAADPLATQAPGAAAGNGELDGPADSPAESVQRENIAPEPSEPIALEHTAEDEVPDEDHAKGFQLPAQRKAVRVPNQLLENLVNLAGETSISRSRAEQQVSEFSYSLDEMQGTVERLQDKLRRLEIETEAQIVFRQEQVEQEGLSSFDPLEMDRYSQLQTLSRSLMESASDLMDLKNTLKYKAREMDSLLQQQSRINSDLQEGLMQSRMVPFTRLVPRLRRTVRQVAKELNKEVKMELLNIDGEMDRDMLESMIPPLQHMLRNAVDHGIEAPEQRRASDKPEIGLITLGIGREGNDVVITIEDDGSGIDVERVREKAIAAGSIDAELELSEAELLKLILESGVTTAQELTQISGRGVGLDIVGSEVRKLGGSVEVYSEQGIGTKFVIRLPFTVSVNRALTVKVAEEVYAVPLNSIEGIVRIAPADLQKFYEPDAGKFEYAGQPYELRYLGALLKLEARPDLEEVSDSCPLILVRSGDTAVAIHVDALHGSREVVVKSLGPQFAEVPGVAGATVAGSGSVVIILDLLRLVRQSDFRALDEWAASEQEQEPVAEDNTVRVLVVDDSVTVRKVTTRFLERHGMEVSVARDGVEAMNLLEDSIPDIMLLDIEMPRMDGFEVAKQVRNSGKTRDLPIIMITSRTAQKHRDRAIDIGINKYLGKPYQETELLEAIANELDKDELGSLKA